MKLRELLPQLHDKTTYFICLNRTTSFPRLFVTKANDIKMIKLPLTLVDVYMLSLVKGRTALLGSTIMNTSIDPTESVEYKHSYIRFNKNKDYENWYIAQTKQGLVNAAKMLFKKYKLPLGTYKYLIATIKESE